MIFRPDLAALVLCGEKSVTRRAVSPNPRSPWFHRECRIAVGREYAVQAGRGKARVGTIRATSVRRGRLGFLTNAEARREGFPRSEAFWLAWRSLHGTYDAGEIVWRIEFEYVGPRYGKALARVLRSVAWELRTCWAQGLRISLRVLGDVERVEGHVRTVSPTDAFVVVGDLHVPLDRVLAVYRPSRLGDSDFDDRGRERWRGQVPRGARRDPRQTELEA